MILVAASLITACVNKQEKGPITISGKIDASAVSGSASGPTLVAVAKTDSIEAIERDPAGAIVMIAGIDEHSGTYELELGEYDVQPGDHVTIIAFIDNAYANGIPYPKRGDFIGFYIEPSSLSTSYALKAGANPNLDIAHKPRGLLVRRGRLGDHRRDRGRRRHRHRLCGGDHLVGHERAGHERSDRLRPRQ